jgi:hypothetical protein
VTTPGSSVILVVTGDRIPLPVEIRDGQLGLVTRATVDERITLPPGTYAITVPQPRHPDFHRVVHLDSEQELIIDLPTPRLRPPSGELVTGRQQPLVDAAVALVERGQLQAAVHVLSARAADLDPDARALLGFTALRLNDTELAEDASRTEHTSPDLLALRAALLRHSGEDDVGPTSQSARLVRQALDMGMPRLADAARSLVSAIRDNQLSPTPESRDLIRVVRTARTDHVLLTADEGVASDQHVTHAEPVAWTQASAETNAGANQVRVVRAARSDRILHTAGVRLAPRAAGDTEKDGSGQEYRRQPGSAVSGHRSSSPHYEPLSVGGYSRFCSVDRRRSE